MLMEMELPGMLAAQSGPMKAKMSAVITQKVLGVRSDGAARLRVSIGDLNVNMPGVPQRQTKPPNIGPMTLLVSKDGSVLEASGLDAMATALQMPGFDYQQLVGQMGMLPDWPVEIGDGWKQKVPIPFGGGQMNIISTLLDAAVPVDGRSAAKIKQTFDAHLDLADVLRSVSGITKTCGQQPPQIPEMNGNLDLTGWAVLYFSTERGKLLKATRDVSATIKIGLPAQGVQSGSTPRMEISMFMNMKFSVTKI